MQSRIKVWIAGVLSAFVLLTAGEYHPLRADAARVNSCEYGAFGGDDGGAVPDHLAKTLQKMIAQEKRVPSFDELAEATGLNRKILSSLLPGSAMKNRVKDFLSSLDWSAYPKLQNLRRSIYKSYVKFLAENLMAPPDEETAASVGISVDLVEVLIGTNPLTVDDLVSVIPDAKDLIRKETALYFANLVKTYGRTFSDQEFAAEIEQSLEELVWLFGDKNAVFEDFSEIKDMARDLKPKYFDQAIDTDIFNAERTARMITAFQEKKRFVVTTAISGAEIDESFLAAIKKYCQDNHAALVVLPANMITNELDPRLLSEDWIHVLTNEAELSRFLRISDIKVTAKQFDPLASMDNVGPRSQSVVVASPKMTLRVVATARNTLHPHFLLSTGAITKPNYHGRLFKQRRTDHIAKEHHRLGALIVEKPSKESLKIAGSEKGDFHFRHLSYSAKERGFFDINRWYGADSRTKVEAPVAMVLGDLHVAKLDRAAFAAAKEQIKNLKPEYVVLHDIFDGSTVNHWQSNDVIESARSSMTQKNILADELRGVIDVLNELLAINPKLKIVVARANHDIWLDRWLREAKFMEDADNRAMGLLLAKGLVVDGSENALEYAVKTLGHSRENQDVFTAKLTDNSRVRFLGKSELFSVGPAHRPVELSFHGHAGVNGSKGLTLKTLSTITDSAVTAHRHTIGLYNDVVLVGTLTPPYSDYQDGPTNWVQSIVVVNADGQKQNLIYRWGEFLSGDGNVVPKGFYAGDYPVIKESSDSQD